MDMNGTNENNASSLTQPGVENGFAASNLSQSDLPDQQISSLETAVEASTRLSPLPSPVTTEVPLRPASRTSEVAPEVPTRSDNGSKHDASSSEITPDQALEAALQNASARAEAESEIDSGSDVEMLDSYAPDPNVLAPVSTQSPAGKNGESDTYEPPEATPPAADSVLSPDSPPFSPAPPEAVPDDLHTDIQPDSAATISSTRVSKEPSPNVEEISLPLAPAKESDSAFEHRKTFYTPYESPLKNFRAYRFHPAFEKEVTGGYKSLTYSNKIKDDQEVCRYELAGGVCNDAACEFQHFKDMGLADDTILVELGNSAGYTEEEKPRFVAGLRTVLHGLREQKTKDFQVIASEIAAYRARFLGDSSRVLLLHGSAI